MPSPEEATGRARWRARAHVATLATVLAAVAIVAASRREAQRIERATEGAPVTAILSGCAAMHRAGDDAGKDAVCQVPADGSLRVWVDERPESVEVRVDGVPVAPQVEREVAGGALLRVAIARGAVELSVHDGRGRARAWFALAPPGKLDWLDRAADARRHGDSKGARQLAEAAMRTGSDGDRAHARGLLARLDLASGRVDEAIAGLHASRAAHLALGSVSAAADDSFALVFALNQRSHRYREAREVLDDVRRWVAPYAEGRARERYYRGTLESETGDAREAFALLGEARVEAAKVGLSLLERNAASAYALQLALVGRSDEALSRWGALAREVDHAADAGPCERLEIAINASFAELLRHEERGSAPGDPTFGLETAMGRCEDRYLAAAALGNVTLGRVQRGELAQAKADLTRARAMVRDGARAVERLFQSDLAGRIALGERDAARAREAFGEEVALADRTASLEARYRARVGLGEASELGGATQEAIAHYRAAERDLSALSLLIPLGEGRGTFVGDRSRSARLAVDALVRTGRVDEALAVARAARARIVRSVAHVRSPATSDGPERERWESALGAYRAARASLEREAADEWKLARDERTRRHAERDARDAALRADLERALAMLHATGAPWQDESALDPLPDDATTLAFHPVRQGWVALVHDGGATKSFALGALPDLEDRAATAAALLAPLGELRADRELRVLAYGPVRAVDVHALPYRGATVGDRAPVSYPVDLPVRRRAAPSGAMRALVVGDPTLDLESAGIESERIAKRLAERPGWTVAVLEGPRATAEAVARALPEADLFHYAGHGRFAGHEGWESSLPLARGGRLAVGDILALASVPSRVVLSGCDAARSDAESAAESLGLAQAFVLAGASFVVAPVRPVSDALAARMSEALYGALASPGPVDAARALRDAQRAVRGADPSLDWSAFRVVGR